MLEFTGSAASCWGPTCNRFPLCQVPASAREGRAAGIASEVDHWIITTFPFLKHMPSMATRWRYCLVRWRIFWRWISRPLKQRVPVVTCSHSPNSPLVSSPYSFPPHSFFPRCILIYSAVGPALCLPGRGVEKPPRKCPV